MQPNEGPKSDSIHIDVPQQGIDRMVDREGVIKFLQDEKDFFASIGPLLNENIQFARQGFGNLQSLARNAEQFLTRTQQQIGEHNKYDLLAEYLGFARSMTVIVGQGAIGERIKQLQDKNRREEAKWILAIYSSEWFAENLAELAALRSLVLGSPTLTAATDLISAATARSEATESMKRSEESAAGLKKFIEEKTSLIIELERLYREKLIIEGPAKYWADVAVSRTRAWRLWLSLFAALVVVPVMLIVTFWNDFGSVVQRFTSSSNGPISIAGVAALTIPALLYGWLLKNVSRMFIHHLNGADDAAHRRALCITYLGLAENPKLEIAAQDRALILNALFRPAPHQGLEEGPPSGLLDLIKPKSA
jgi:hypothetical protein